MFNTSNWIRGGCRNVSNLFVTSPALPLFHCKVHCTVPCVRLSFALMNSQWIEYQLIRMCNITATLKVSLLIVFWVGPSGFRVLIVPRNRNRNISICVPMFLLVLLLHIMHNIVHSFARIYVGSFGCFSAKFTIEFLIFKHQFTLYLQCCQQRNVGVII